VIRSTIADNVANGTWRSTWAGNGGGIASASESPDGVPRVTIFDSTVSGNRAAGEGLSYIGNGGGVLIQTGEAALINTTLSGNWATGVGGPSSGYGGGLWVGGDLAPANVTLVNTTLGSNKAATGGAGLTAWFYSHVPSVAFQNTLFAGNGSSADPTAGLAVNVTSCYNWGGTLISLGHNLEDRHSCNLDQPTDLPDTIPLLGLLRDNGGPTATQALPEESPAVDAGRCEGVGADQRGYPRPKDHPNVTNVTDACDIGAYEVQEDTIGPAIKEVFPPDGLENVPLDTPVRIEFNEPISCATLCDCCQPALGNWTPRWNEAATVVTFTHDPMLPETSYTVVITDAQDVAGNTLVGLPFDWSFTTRPELEHGIYLPFLFK
jgi:hypothetical protein